MNARNVLPPGTLLDGKYRIDRLIGAGGFGMTYAALDQGLNQTVAIKEYYPAHFGVRQGTLTVGPASPKDEDIFARLKDSFLREARTLAQFRHSAIVRVLSVFEGHGTAYMVMEHETGKSLKAWLDGLGRMPAQNELDRLVMPLLDALDTMHQASFLHRDIAPDNIIVRADGGPVLLDFGAARRVMAELSGALTGIVKQGYSPQEQYANDPRAQGAWSDIYALGATLYRCVSGRTPDEATLRMLDDPLQPASDLRLEGFRPGFLAAIDRSMALRPKDRPQSIGELRALLTAPAPAPAEPTQIAAQSEPVRANTSAPGNSAPGTGGWSRIGSPASRPATPVIPGGHSRPAQWLNDLSPKVRTLMAGGAIAVVAGMAWAMIGPDGKPPLPPSISDAQPAGREQVAAPARPAPGVPPVRVATPAAATPPSLPVNTPAARMPSPAAPGGELATTIDNALGRCTFCDDVAKSLTPEDAQQLRDLPAVIERTWLDVRNRRGPRENAAAHVLLDKLVAVDLQPDPLANLKLGRVKCTTYEVGNLENAAERVGTHACDLRMVRVGGEVTSLTLEKATGDGFFASFKPYRTHAMAYLGRSFLKGHAVTRYNAAVPKNRENDNFGNVTGLLVSLGGKPALLSINQNGFTDPDPTYFQIIVLE